MFLKYFPFRLGHYVRFIYIKIYIKQESFNYYLQTEIKNKSQNHFCYKIGDIFLLLNKRKGVLEIKKNTKKQELSTPSPYLTCYRVNHAMANQFHLSHKVFQPLTEVFLVLSFYLQYNILSTMNAFFVSRWIFK